MLIAVRNNCCTGQRAARRQAPQILPFYIPRPAPRVHACMCMCACVADSPAGAISGASAALPSRQRTR